MRPRADAAAGDHLVAGDDQERGVRRERSRGTHERQQLVPDRDADRDPCERVAAEFAHHGLDLLR